MEKKFWDCSFICFTVDTVVQLWVAAAANRRPKTVQLFSNALRATATMHFNCAGYHINQGSLNGECSPCVYPLNNLPRSTAGITTTLFWVFIHFGSGCCFPTGGSRKFRFEAQMCIFKATSYILPSKKRGKKNPLIDNKALISENGADVGMRSAPLLC